MPWLALASCPHASSGAFSATSEEHRCLRRYWLELEEGSSYTPDAVQIAQLHDPPTARKQVTEVMSALLTLHPELRGAFHGIWVHANQENTSLFALVLPMDQIVVSSAPPGAQSSSFICP